MDKIYVLKKGKFISGPFTLEYLQQKGLKSLDKIWYESLSDWQDAEALSSLGVPVSEPAIPVRKKANNLLFWKKS